MSDTNRNQLDYTPKMEQNQNNSYITSQMNNLPILFFSSFHSIVLSLSIFLSVFLFSTLTFLCFFFFLVGFNHLNVCESKLELKEKMNTFSWLCKESKEPTDEKKNWNRRRLQNLNVHVLKKRLGKHLNYNAWRSHLSPSCLPTRPRYPSIE